LHPEVASAVEEALHVIAALSAEMRELELKVPADRKLQSAEAYAFHSEFLARSPELYCAETLRRIRSGENISQGEISTLRQELVRARSDIQAVFKTVDLLVTPTTPMPAPSIAELKADLDNLRHRELLLLRNTRPFNVWGLPALSLPCGFTQDGLPIGLQIAGPPWGEAGVLRLAYAFEQSTDWHKREAPL
jgi:aspartyl-tRNA(Asn)/glutamyl-tRNA(Gln) amidotransferase subunit A